MTIGQRVKIRREELGMSQEELATKVGYKSKSSINKIELGFRVLTQSKIKVIADALETTPSYIMGWDEESHQNEWSSKFRDSVMQILNNADPADLKAAGISVQEIEEELDTEIAVGNLVGTIEYDYPAFHLSMDCFWCEVVSGDLVLKEAEAARWLTKDDIDSVPWLPADQTILDVIRSSMQPVKPLHTSEYDKEPLQRC